MAFRHKHQTRPTLDQIALADPEVEIGLALDLATYHGAVRDDDHARVGEFDRRPPEPALRPSEPASRNN